MAKCSFTILLIILAFGWSPAQIQNRPSQLGMLRNQQSLTTSVGLTVVDGKPYYLFNLTPELSFGKLGIGLDLNIRVGEDGKIRKEDFNEAYDYLRVLRYVRWAHKRDPLYVRAGSLDYARLGHGSIMYMYRNSPSYEQRKIGVEFDVDGGKYGFESVYSDIAGAGVLGLRPYFRPLKGTSAGDIPILGGLEIGATYAADFHERAKPDRSTLVIFGFDVGLPLLSLPSLHSTLYSDYTKIVDYGSGVSAGVDLNFTGLGFATLNAKYERRFMGDQFLPSYFDAFYEMERYVPYNDPLALTGRLDKVAKLETAKKTDGYYGELWLSILGTFNVIGGYYSPVGIENAGILHVELETGNVLPGIVLIGGYDKKNVGPVFKVDNNSLLYAQVGYKPLPYFLVSVVYQWTFIENKDEFGIVRGYVPQKRIEPKVGFVFNF
ncbi:MAG: hypothetical protein HY088_00925 [Ignavibacteriales bacterium]|nr:hypothetical protein [Ignavibacteriales bacterium]